MLAVTTAIQHHMQAQAAMTDPALSPKERLLAMRDELRQANACLEIACTEVQDVFCGGSPRMIRQCEAVLAS